MEKSVWIDYKQLKRDISISDVLAFHNITLENNGGDQLHGSCPLPGHEGDRDNRQAFSVSKAKNCWRCFSSCGSGNVISLHAMLTGRNPEDSAAFRSAAVELHEWLENEIASVSEQVSRCMEDPAPNYASDSIKPNEPLSFALQVKGDVPFLLEEKQFPAEIIKEFGLGWCAKGMFSGRIVVPIHNANDELVAYAGRGLKDNDIRKRGRWLLPKNFRKSLELFNQHRAVEMNIAEHGLVVVEGFWSAIRWHQAGQPAVALMGAELSEAQCKRIAELTDRVWLMLDRDNGGQSSAPKIVNRLANHVFVRLVSYPDGDDRRQPESFTPEGLAALIAE